MPTALTHPPVTEQEWRAVYSLTPERDSSFTTLSGEPIKPLYTAEDLSAADRVGFPGQYPFTRGVYPSMYRGRLWTMRQFAGFGCCGNQRTLPLSARPWADRPQHRV